MHRIEELWINGRIAFVCRLAPLHAHAGVIPELHEEDLGAVVPGFGEVDPGFVVPGADELGVGEFRDPEVTVGDVACTFCKPVARLRGTV